MSLNKIWTWLDGKKLIIGGILSIIQLLASFAAGVGTILGTVFPATSKVVIYALATSSFLFTASGLLHKAWKKVYHEDHP